MRQLSFSPSHLGGYVCPCKLAEPCAMRAGNVAGDATPRPCPGGQPHPGWGESYRIIGWKRPLRSSSPTSHPTTPCLLNHILKWHIYMFFKHLQGWGLNHLPGQPVPMPEHSFSKEIFPNIQSKPPLRQLQAIASHPIASYLGEETNTRLTTTSFQAVVGSNKVPLQPPLLQNKQPRLPQLLLLRLVL